MSMDPLVVEHVQIRAHVSAWIEAWSGRRDVASSSTAILFGAVVQGEPLATRLEQRLLLARAHLERRIANLAGALGAAIARRLGEDDPSALERRLHDTVSAVGSGDYDFASKLAELEPLVAAYRRILDALDGPA